MLQNEASVSIDPPLAGTGSGSMPGVLRNLTGGQGMTRHGVDLDRAPTLFRKVQVEATILLGDPEVNSPHGAVELSPGFQEIKG